MPAGILAARRKLCDFLIPVHRSYLVNPDYISSIERYTLTLLNGTKIPIPVRKYNEVREVLLHFYEGAEA